jgi:hypothetical protein
MTIHLSMPFVLMGFSPVMGKLRLDHSSKRWATLLDS